MVKQVANKVFVQLLVTMGVLAVVAGGLLAAFSAHQPTEFALWSSAYLVLVGGVLQVGFGLTAYRLAHRGVRWVAPAAFVLYNLGNVGVILGVALRATLGTVLVDMGGVLLALGVVALVYSIYGAKRSWLLIGFYLIALVIVVSMPIGLVLAR